MPVNHHDPRYSETASQFGLGDCGLPLKIFQAFGVLERAGIRVPAAVIFVVLKVGRTGINNLAIRIYFLKFLYL